MSKVPTPPDLSPPRPYRPLPGEPCAREPMGCDGRVAVRVVPGAPRAELACGKCGWKVEDE